MLPEVRMARITDAIGLHRSKKLSCVEAAEMLGLSERHFRRLRDAYEAEGAEGIIDGRRGRTSGRRAPADEIEWMVEEFRRRYFDFTVKQRPVWSSWPRRPARRSSSAGDAGLAQVAVMRPATSWAASSGRAVVMP